MKRLDGLVRVRLKMERLRGVVVVSQCTHIQTDYLWTYNVPKKTTPAKIEPAKLFSQAKREKIISRTYRDRLLFVCRLRHFSARVQLSSWRKSVK